MSSLQPPRENRVAQSIALKKLIGSAEKNRVGRENGTTGIFIRLSHKIGGVKLNFGRVEHFIRRVREILGGGGGLTPLTPVNLPFL